LAESMWPLAEAVFAPMMGSLLGFPVAMGVALSWPLSGENLTYALKSGGVWGAIGALVIVVLTALVPPARRHLVAVAGSVAWVVVSMLCFFVTVVLVAGC
jgi:hypothetical protein